jgi:serine/threonine protein kinase
MFGNLQRKQFMLNPTTYKKVEKLGEGACGRMFKVVDTTDGTIYAFKKETFELDENGDIPDECIRETLMLEELKHPNIIRLNDVIYNKNNIYLVLEYIEMDLLRIYRYRRFLSTEPLSPIKIKSIVYQILQGIAYCHAQGIVHGCLAPHYIRLTNRNEIKIAEFCAAHKIGEHEESNQIYVLWYRAPEILLGQTQYLPATDIWAIGCIFAELVLEKPLLPGSSEVDELLQIFRLLRVTQEQIQGRCNLPVQTDQRYNKERLWNIEPLTAMQHGFDLLSKMLTFDPEQRITASKALDHKYFDEIRLELSQKYT